VKVDTLVVGAGFSGSTIAERLTAAGQEVLVIDRRPHLGGTVHDYRNHDGYLISSHGAHLFHTNAKHVADYLGQFTRWVPHRHRVLAEVIVDGEKTLVPMPVNRQTVNTVLGLDLVTEEDVGRFYEAEREDLPRADTSEAKVVGAIGRRLFDALYRDYTLKQWDMPASALSGAVAGRLPFRTNDDDGYFEDWFQAQPIAGWTPIFENMLRGIEVWLGAEWKDVRNAVEFDRVVFTGPPDEFFDYELGRLPFRSVRFEHRYFDTEGPVQPVGVVNYCHMGEPATRSIEWRHITGEVWRGSVVSYEFSEAHGDPHYPIPCQSSWDLHRAYRELAAKTPFVTFAGRLGSYRYMTMDQTVAQALKLASKLAAEPSLR
jgi:UDP-galactopyranose mutase